MKKYAHLKARARILRKRDGKTLNELAEMMAMPRSTVYYWIRDLPLPYDRIVEGRRKAARIALGAMQRKYAKLRQEAYDLGMATVEELARDSTFRDFVTMYIGEGTKRNRNTVGVCNSDPSVIQLCAYWIRRLANPERHLEFALRYFEDHDTDILRTFWAKKLGIEPSSIKLRPKTSSKKLAHRNWRSKYGVMAVRVGDTYLRARLEAWMDWIKGQWQEAAGSNPAAPTVD